MGFFCFINVKKTTDSPKVSFFDQSFLRGDGVFEVVRILKGGKLRAIQLHLDRLNSSAKQISSRLDIQRWLQEAAEAGREGSVRLVATKGDPSDLKTTPPKVFISWSPLPKWPTRFSLQPTFAPWHTSCYWESIPKWLSYGPNVYSTRLAKEAGYTDAMLLANCCPAAGNNEGTNVSDLGSMYLLDGPNFAVGWITREKILQFPTATTKGLLVSTTQQLVVRATKEVPSLQNLFKDVREGCYTLNHVLQYAKELFVQSSTRGIIPVDRIGETNFEIPDGSGILFLPWTNKIKC